MHMLTDRQLAERFQVSRVSIWRWTKFKPEFPKPITISAGCVRWRLADIEAFEAKLAAQANAASAAA